MARRHQVPKWLAAACLAAAGMAWLPTTATAQTQPDGHDAPSDAGATVSVGVPGTVSVAVSVPLPGSTEPVPPAPNLPLENSPVTVTPPAPVAPIPPQPSIPRSHARPSPGLHVVTPTLPQLDLPPLPLLELPSLLTERRKPTGASSGSVVTGSTAPAGPSGPASPAGAPPPSPPSASPPGAHGNAGASARGQLPSGPAAAGRPGGELADAAVRTATRFSLPLGLTGLVIAFLAMQALVDRRDPKLFAAPMDDELFGFE